MKLKSIEISNIKGISNHIFDLDVFPNKPIVLVAPNGFGKSSLAIGFDSLKPSAIDLDKENFHLGNSSLIPEIKITYEDGSNVFTVAADASSNNISSTFKTYTINNRLTAKAKMLNIKGVRIAVPSMEVEPIVLVKTIPQDVRFDYDSAESKRSFGTNGKILPNITQLLKNIQLLRKIRSIDYLKFNQVGYTKVISSFVDDINSQSGTADRIKSWMNNQQQHAIHNLSELATLQSYISNASNGFASTFADSFLIAVQIIALKSKMNADFLKAIDYQEYLDRRTIVEDLLASVNSTRLIIKPVVDGKSLVIKLPKATQISNGQRDVLNFIGSLNNARKTLIGSNNILIIDEVFDYLDDANLITFQYYVTNFIESYKKYSRNIFPIMLTHLDPDHFRHFCFNKHKMQIRHLKSIAQSANPDVLSLIKHRDNASIKDKVDKHYLHYCPTSISLAAEFTSLGISSKIDDSTKFYNFISSQFQAYKSGIATYCPYSICIALRLEIEMKLESMIASPTDKQALILIHGTNNKIEFCNSIGIETPEIFSLLGIIYNDKLHWHNNYDTLAPLAIKLENKTIKRMIERI